MYLKIHNLSYIYNKEVFVYHDYCFNRGITIISGESGKGKSTLFRLLIKSIKPYTGFISWNDKNIEEYDTFQYLDSILSIVFQGAIISYYFTLREYIALLIIHEDQRRELAEFYLDVLGLYYLLDMSILHCSGGEKYKIALFLSLLKNVPLLLLDEPTSYLDRNYSIMVFSLLKKINDKVILIITHDQLFFEKTDTLQYYYL
jgi:ABC-type multidrug transport system ATPase subunit